MPILQLHIVKIYFKQKREGLYYNFFFSLFPYEPPGNAERLVCNFSANGRCPAGDNYLSRVPGFFFRDLK